MNRGKGKCQGSPPSQTLGGRGSLRENSPHTRWWGVEVSSETPPKDNHKKGREKKGHPKRVANLAATKEKGW